MLRTWLAFGVFAVVSRVSLGDILRYGPWTLIDHDNSLDFIDNSGDHEVTIALAGLPGTLNVEMITSRHRITSITGVALRDPSKNTSKNKSVEHVFIFRDDGVLNSLTRSIDGFLHSILPPGISEESMNKYRDFMRVEIDRENFLRDEARAATKAEIQARREQGIPLRVSLGEVRSGASSDGAWVETSIHTLDVTDDLDFAELFAPGSVVSFRAEHVLEHLSLVEAFVALTNVVRYLKPGGKIRIAVPDYGAMRALLIGFSDPEEHLLQKDLAEGHKVRYTRESLSILLATAGFHRVEVKEYCSGDGQLISEEGWHEDGGGRIRRSAQGGEPISMVMDAYTHVQTV